MILFLLFSTFRRELNSADRSLGFNSSDEIQKVLSQRLLNGSPESAKVHNNFSSSIAGDLLKRTEQELAGHSDHNADVVSIIEFAVSSVKNGF